MSRRGFQRALCLDALRQSRPPYLTPPEERVAERRAAGESVAGGKKVVPDLLAPATPPRGRIAVGLLAWLSHLGQGGVSRERLAEMEISPRGVQSRLLHNSLAAAFDHRFVTDDWYLLLFTVIIARTVNI
jgi:hypothetical protein